MGEIVTLFENAFEDHKFDGSHRLRHDLDANGYSILNPLGIGDVDGKAIRFCITEAEVIAACEDADVRLVYILQKDVVPTSYTFSATIAPTSNKKIIGLGDVQLDWDGAANGFMFLNNTGDDISIKNVYWAKTGNNYLPLHVRHRFLMEECRGIWTGNYIYTVGNDATYRNNHMTTGIYLGSGVGAIIDGGSYGVIRIVNTQTAINNIKLTENYIFIDNTAFGSSRLINISNSYLAPTTGGVGCIYIAYISGTPADLSALKVSNCYMKPNNDTLPCVYVSDNANNSSSNVIFENNTFDVCSDVYEIANGTHTDWVLANNRYLSYTGDIINNSGTLLGWDLSQDGAYE